MFLQNVSLLPTDYMCYVPQERTLSFCYALIVLIFCEIMGMALEGNYDLQYCFVTFV
jgi:hypothetical protein